MSEDESENESETEPDGKPESEAGAEAESGSEKESDTGTESEDKSDSEAGTEDTPDSELDDGTEANATATVETVSDVKNDDGQLMAYDFSHPQHRLGQQVPRLEIGGKDFASAVNRLVDNNLHIPCEVSLASASLQKYQECIEGIEDRACIFDCRLAGIPANVLLCFEQNLVLKFVEKYFGGKSVSAEETTRGYSTTEKRLANRFYDCVITSMNEVWEPVFSASKTGNGLLSRSEVLVIEAESSIVAVVRCLVKIGETETHFSVVLPWQAFLLIRHSTALSQPGKTSEDARWQRNLSEKISTCEVDVHGLLAETRVTVEHLLKMQTGDFIPLGEQQTATFMIDNTPVFNALIGTSKSQVSASFLSWIGQGESSI